MYRLIDVQQKRILMKRPTIHHHDFHKTTPSILTIFMVIVILIQSLATATATETEQDWNWEKILVETANHTHPIISNGNVFPAPVDENASDCFILATRNQFMWHCPSLNTTSTSSLNKQDKQDDYERHIIYRSTGRFRGLVSAPGTDGRRMWILDSPRTHDELIEIDTITGELLQSLVIGGTNDGHDAVRVDNIIYIVDTRHGDVVEVDLPISMPPYTQSTLDAGASRSEKEGYVNVRKRHRGFTRKDHINNVAVHQDLLLTNLHGGRAIKMRDANNGGGNHAHSPTRLSALSKKMPEDEGRELNLDMDGFTNIDNVGTWCHGIAFWEDKANQQIKLIGLDSKMGTLVSVVLTGPNQHQREREREVLWEPDLTHPVLVPPKGIAAHYTKGGKIFSKGLAVQGGVAYFGVSYAREPVLRQTVPESLLVAVDLSTKKELFVRVIRSNGLINQIVTKSHLGFYPQLPKELSTVEITLHGAGGQMVTSCDNSHPVNTPDDFCIDFEEFRFLCHIDPFWMVAEELCCVCGGGERSEHPLMAGELDGEVMKLTEHVTATATFLTNDSCLDATTHTTKKLDLAVKKKDAKRTIRNFDKDLNSILKHVCNLNVQPIAERFRTLGDTVFTNDYQVTHGNSIITERKAVMNNIKPGTSSLQLIFSARDVSEIFHFPWLDDWLPMIQELVLTPMGIPLKSVIRMMFANMPPKSTINFHHDLNPWVQKSHRVHIPIITHKDIFFLTEIPPPSNDNAEDYHYEQVDKNGEPTNKPQILRIKSKAGEVYEFNNAMAHAVRNLGASRVHLILDWMEDVVDDHGNTSYDLIKTRPGERCAQLKGFQTLQCEMEDEGDTNYKDAKDEL